MPRGSEGKIPRWDAATAPPSLTLRMQGRSLHRQGEGRECKEEACTAELEVANARKKLAPPSCHAGDVVWWTPGITPQMSGWCVCRAGLCWWYGIPYLTLPYLT